MSATNRQRLAEIFRRFADTQAHTTPLYEALSRRVAADPALLDLAAHVQASQRPPNMLFAAVQYLLLRDRPDHPLTAFYPAFRDPPAEPRDAGAPFADFCRLHAGEIAGILRTRRVNTNEPGRAAVLRPLAAMALGMVAGPLHWVEIGCSAGLLLAWPRFAIDYIGCSRAGPADGALSMACEVRGERCPPVDVDERRLGRFVGIESAPLDPGDPDDALWLRALIWPEHRERAGRIDAALRLAAANPPEIRAGDALDLLPGVAAELPAGEALAVAHSLLMGQFDDAARRRLDEVLRAIARGRPLLRLGNEWVETRAEGCLTDYRAATPARRVLAHADAHGRWIRWLGA